MGSDTDRSHPPGTTRETRTEYSTRMKSQLAMVGLTAGTLRRSESQVDSAPARTDCPARTANVVRLRRVLPPAVKIWKQN